MTDVLTEAPADLGVTRTEITVGISDLRNGLRSVVVHAGTEKEIPTLQRVRAVIQHGNLILTATNRYTLGVAAVSIWDNTYDDDGVIIDLPITQVAETLALFRSTADRDEDGGDDDLRIRVTDRYITATDTAGLFDGKTMTWPRITTAEDFPDLIRAIGGMLAKAGTGRASTLHTNGKLLTLFRAAATVYKAPVVLEPTKDDNGPLCVSIGESFIGALMPIKPTDESLAEQASWRSAWHARLGLVDLDTGELRD